MQMFDENANPESIAARAAELALEQLDRLRDYMEDHPGKGADFYKQSFEGGTSNNIAKLMAAYAVLMGYVTKEQAGLKV